VAAFRVRSRRDFQARPQVILARDGKPGFFLHKKRYNGRRILFGELAQRPRHGLDDHIVPIADEQAADAQELR
jgi:hypothetical protein